MSAAALPKSPTLITINRYFKNCMVFLLPLRPAEDSRGRAGLGGDASCRRGIPPRSRARSKDRPHGAGRTHQDKSGVKVNPVEREGKNSGRDRGQKQRSEFDHWVHRGPPHESTSFTGDSTVTAITNRLRVNGLDWGQTAKDVARHTQRGPTPSSGSSCHN